MQLAAGDFAAAATTAYRCTQRFVDLGDRRGEGWALEIIAEAALASGVAELAARVWGASQPLRAAPGFAGAVTKFSENKELGSSIRDALSEDRFDALVGEGSQDPSTVLDSISSQQDMPDP